MHGYCYACMGMAEHLHICLVYKYKAVAVTVYILREVLVLTIVTH